MAVVYTSYSLRMEEAIKESVVRESTETHIHERVKDGEWQWRMHSIKSSAMSDIFIVPFTFLGVSDWLLICK